MKSKHQIVPQPQTTKKPAKAHLTDAEFRLRLKNISDWRRNALPSFTPRIRVEVYVPIRYHRAYQASLTWVIEEFTQLRGGCTVNESAGGYYLSRANEVIADRVNVVTAISQ